jgi:hypothetical protein
MIYIDAPPLDSIPTYNNKTGEHEVRPYGHISCSCLRPTKKGRRMRRPYR